MCFRFVTEIGSKSMRAVYSYKNEAAWWSALVMLVTCFSGLPLSLDQDYLACGKTMRMPHWEGIHVSPLGHNWSNVLGAPVWWRRDFIFHISKAPFFCMISWFCHLDCNYVNKESCILTTSLSPRLMPLALTMRTRRKREHSARTCATAVLPVQHDVNM